jgi:caffeoyl-CoA O-methyltransferase
MKFLDDKIEDYISRHTSKESGILKELVQRSEEKLEHTDMISGKQVGRLLNLLVRLGRCKRILEIGTFTGYSAIWMADALPEDGELITLDMNEKYKEISDGFFNREPYKDKIRQIMGPALESIDAIPGEFDLVYIDADKHQYPDYFLKIKPRLKSGGILVVDNVLWSGEVLEPADPKSMSVDRLNRMIQEDEDFDNIMLPIRDGVTIGIKN